MRTALLNFAIFLPLAASAQDTVTKTGTNYFVQTEGRESAVCGVEFVILYRDATYRKGAPAMITGSLSWLEIKGEFTLILKIAGMDFENSSPSNPAPFRMSSAFLSTKNESPRMTGTQCEDRRTFCGSLALPASLSALDALNEGTLRIGFNREVNGPDVILPLDGSISSTRDKQAFADFRSCSAKLRGRVQPRLR